MMEENTKEFKSRIRSLNKKRRMIGGPVVVYVKKDGAVTQTQDRTHLKKALDDLEGLINKGTGLKPATGIKNHRR